MDPIITCIDVRHGPDYVQVEMGFGEHRVRYRLLANSDEEIYVDGIATTSPYQLGKALGTDGSVEADMDLIELVRGKGHDCIIEARMSKKIAQQLSPDQEAQRQTLMQRTENHTNQYLDKLKTQLNQAKTEPERRNIEHSIMQLLKSQHLNQRDLQVEIDKLMNRRVAHPVWDLSNGDEGPVIVRKVPEESERTKGSDLGWLNKNVATYIGGQPVVAKVASVNDDGTYDLETENGDKIAGVAEEFIDFGAR